MDWPLLAQCILPCSALFSPRWLRSAKWERFLFKYDLGWSTDCSQNFWSFAYSTTVTGLIPTYFLCLGFPGGPAGKQSTCSAGDPGSIPGSGRSPGEWNGYPLQYSCLENPMDRGVWQATVHGVTKESDMTEQVTGEERKGSAVKNPPAMQETQEM